MRVYAVAGVAYVFGSIASPGIPWWGSLLGGFVVGLVCAWARWRPASREPK
jgi:hypothetical protein